jgi:hypothetical protein
MKVMLRKIFSETLLLQDPKLGGKSEDAKIVDDVQPGSYGALAGPLDGQVRNIMTPEWLLSKLFLQSFFHFSFLSLPSIQFPSSYPFFFYSYS